MQMNGSGRSIMKLPPPGTTYVARLPRSSLLRSPSSGSRALIARTSDMLQCFRGTHHGRAARGEEGSYALDGRIIRFARPLVHEHLLEFDRNGTNRRAEALVDPITEMASLELHVLTHVVCPAVRPFPQGGGKHIQDR